MPRTRWEPKTEAEREAIAAVVRAVAASTAADAELRAAVLAADKLKVPRIHLVEVTGIKERTFYRRINEWTEPAGAEE